MEEDKTSELVMGLEEKPTISKAHPLLTALSWGGFSLFALLFINYFPNSFYILFGPVALGVVLFFILKSLEIAPLNYALSWGGFALSVWLFINYLPDSFYIIWGLIILTAVIGIISNFLFLGAVILADIFNVKSFSDFLAMLGVISLILAPFTGVTLGTAVIFFVLAFVFNE